MRRKLFLSIIIIFVMTTLFSQEIELNQKKALVKDTDLIIYKADLSENALFYPIEIEGVLMEVLAVKVHDGSIRTAFNTCEVCYQSGLGYFVQNGTVVVCQNCGNRYRMSQIGLEKGGCNPVPILPENKIETTETITISREHIIKYKHMFENWKDESFFR